MDDDLSFLGKKCSCMGTLGKLPRIPDENSLDLLRAAPVLSTDDLLLLMGDKKQNPYTLPITTCVERSPSGAKKTPESEDIRKEKDGFTRKRMSTQELVRKLKRTVSAQEAHDYYEDQNYHRKGIDAREQNRRRRAFEKIVPYVNKGFDAGKVHDRAFRIEDFDFLRNCQLPELAQQLKAKGFFRYRYPLVHEDFAVAYWVCQLATQEDGSGPRSHSFGLDRIKAAFITLKAAKVIKRGCDNGKATAIRITLEQAGLITCLERKYRWAGPQTGKSERFIVTPLDGNLPAGLGDDPQKSSRTA